MVTTVIVAAVIAAAGGFVTVQVNGAELNRAKADLKEVQTDTRKLSTEITRIGALREVERETASERWADTKKRLERIEAGQQKIFQSLPRTWRDGARQR